MTPDIDRREVARYLGYRGAEPDAAMAAGIEDALKALAAAAEPRHIARRFPLRWRGETTIAIEGLVIESRALAKNLRGCEEAFLMAATLGIAPDRLIARAQAAGEMGRAMLLQAASAAMIEAFCDQINDGLRGEVAREGLSLRPRFSPGYGDFPLESQAGLFQLLGVQKHVGIALTDALLMIPTKSVTAVIGIARTGCEAPKGCAACDKTDCDFRKN